MNEFTVPHKTINIIKNYAGFYMYKQADCVDLKLPTN